MGDEDGGCEVDCECLCHDDRHPEYRPCDVCGTARWDDDAPVEVVA